MTDTAMPLQSLCAARRRVVTPAPDALGHVATRARLVGLVAGQGGADMYGGVSSRETCRCGMYSLIWREQGDAKRRVRLNRNSWAQS